jgi:formylglycine-generating enzyme required for sulfatase activity
MKKIWIPLLLLTALLLPGCASEVDTAPPRVVDTGVDPDQWVTIPAGEFLQGQHEHTTLIDYDYEIMVTHVTNAQYAEYLNEALAAGTVNLEGTDVVGHYAGDAFHDGRHEKRIEAGDWLHLPLGTEETRLSRQDGTIGVKTGFENHPVTMVSWFGAKAYCESVGGRLPSENEWEKAARGTNNRPFPWGDEIERENANYGSSHDPFENSTSHDTTPVGYYSGRTYGDYETLDSASPYGLYDMAGNVWQWTGDIHHETHLRIMRGGSKRDYGYDLRIWTRNSAEPDYAGPNVGFRCVR